MTLLDRYISHRTARIEQVVELLQGQSEPLTAQDIAWRLYDKMDEQKLNRAVDNILKIVLKLAKEGCARALVADGDDARTDISSASQTSREGHPNMAAVAGQGGWAELGIPEEWTTPQQLPPKVWWEIVHKARL